MTTSVDLDPLSPECIPNPYPVYDRLRGPALHTSELAHTWQTASYPLCLAALRDHRFSSNMAHAHPDLAARDDPSSDSLRQLDTNLLLFTDPPDHTRLRRLANKAFTPRAVERLRGDIAAIAGSLLDDAVGRGTTVDWMASVARPLPLFVICSMLDIPTDDHQQFLGWSDAISRLLDPVEDPALFEAGGTAALQLAQYFFGLAEDRRANPGEDLLTALIQAEEAGDQLAINELLSLFGLLFIAGHETTTNLLGNGLLALLRNPDQLQRLREDRPLLPDAVDELLRYDAPVQVTARIATTDLTLGETQLPAGDQVILYLAGANRDPTEFTDPPPDCLDVGRDARAHLAFSHGVHYCLGASLARLEAEVIFGALLDRHDDIELVTAEPAYRDHRVLRGLRALEVTLG